MSDRLAADNAGDAAAAGEGVSEMRIHYGRGDRVHFLPRRTTLCILLCGGDKSTQQNDIERAKRLARELEDCPWSRPAQCSDSEIRIMSRHPRLRASESREH